MPGLWALIERGGVTAVLFLAVVGLFTGQIFSKRQADQLLKMQADHYEANRKLLEQLWRDEHADKVHLQQLLFQRDVSAGRVAALAERIVERATLPEPATSGPPT